MVFEVYVCVKPLESQGFFGIGSWFHVFGDTDFRNRGGVHFFAGSCTCKRHVYVVGLGWGGVGWGGVQWGMLTFMCTCVGR